MRVLHIIRRRLAALTESNHMIGVGLFERVDFALTDSADWTTSKRQLAHPRWKESRFRVLKEEC